jgi:hypothetical protein
MGDSDCLIMHVGDKDLSKRLDPADLAYRIRRLALDAYRSLKRHDAALDELTELLHRIDELRRGTQNPHFIQIDRWLERAKHLIESRKRLCTSEFPDQGTDRLLCFRPLSPPLAS